MYSNELDYDMAWVHQWFFLLYQIASVSNRMHLHPKEKHNFKYHSCPEDKWWDKLFKYA